MLVREHSPWTRKRARRAAGTRVSRAEELADVTFVLPDDLLLLLVRWHHHAHPPTSSTTLPITSPRRDPHKPHRNRPRHETLPRRRRRRVHHPPHLTHPPQRTHRRVIARWGSAETALSMEAVR